MLRILIADDEKIIRDSLSVMFQWEELGYQLVGTAANGMEAYDQICDLYPDVVITDIRMPILSGLEMIQKIQMLDRNIVFIILSGYGEFEYAKRAMELGVRYFVLKPTNEVELESILSEIADRMAERDKKRGEILDSIKKEIAYPVHRAMIWDGLMNEDNISNIIKNYRTVIHVRETNVHLCFVTFLDETMLSSAIRQIRGLLRKLKIEECFSPVYVKQVLVLTLKMQAMNRQQAFADGVKQMELEYMPTSLEVFFDLFDDFEGCFRSLIKRVNRFGKIFMIQPDNTVDVIRGNQSGVLLIDSQYKALLACRDSNAVEELLKELFHPMYHIEDACALSLCIITRLSREGEEVRSFLINGYMEKIYHAKSVEEILECTQFTVKQMLKLQGENFSERRDLVDALQKYVEEYYYREELSLKWIAEDYLYVNVNYLSRQFTKNTGLKFSEYLNTIRIEKAKQLMRGMPECSVQVIAEMVGFGSNSGYFSQVFKKYTGATPSKFLEENKS